MIDEHGGALEADLIRVGLRLRWCPSPWFTWSDLIVFVKHCGPETDLFRSMHPEEAGWTLTNMLLATIADVLRWLQWAKTKDGQKGHNPPEPIPRPGAASRRRAVHPKGKGGPRSMVRKMLGLPEKRADRAQRLAALFADDGR